MLASAGTQPVLGWVGEVLDVAAVHRRGHVALPDLGREPAPVTPSIGVGSGWPTHTTVA